MTIQPHDPGRDDAPVGVILAGGLASRLGGGHKGLLRVGGLPILARVLAVLRAGCAQVVLNANDAPPSLADLGLPLVPDTLPDRPGPLAGVLAAMEWAAASCPAATHLVTAPGDTPFLPLDLVARLDSERHVSGAGLVCARSGGTAHPVAALWPISLAEGLRRALVEEGLRKVGLFMSRHDVAYVDWPSAPYDPFFNVNTPDDIAEAEAIAARSPT